MSKKILISLSVIGVVAAIVIGATTAFFSDTETSTGNTFTAGSIDLKVDSTCHYWVMDENRAYQDVGCEDDSGAAFGTWTETDLGGAEQFFAFTDLKPGDHGENTLSLHVYDNDAWGRMTITNVSDTGDTCVEPETEMSQSEDADCYNAGPGDIEADGELRENTKFSFWLDQGETPGFQGKDVSGTMIDSTEGDNIWQPATEPLLDGVVPFGHTEGTDVTNGIIEITDYDLDLWEALGIAYSEAGCAGISGTSADGRNNYGDCHGLAKDGRLVGSTTYYFGMAWQIPYDVGNEAQSDGFGGNLKFEAVQHRNNPDHAF